MGAPVGTNFANLLAAEPDLTRLVEAWPALSPDARRRIMAIVAAS